MIIKRKVLLVIVFSTFYSMNAIGAEVAVQGDRGRRQGPPPEAYTACEEKTVGDTAQFTSPRGQVVSGTCEQEGDSLVLRPDHPKARGGGKRQGPPPEAYTACEGKSAGDTAEFTNPHGETLSGTCENVGDLLVLRPDR
ncbi:MAG: hypothetical protein GY808_17770 [Gammaproteobacteria bacterium]|nr:hypothetical protein [Gammaproteobacteria bacterium]